MTYSARESPYWPFYSWRVDPDDGYDLDAPIELAQVITRYRAWGWKLTSAPPTGGEETYRATFSLDLPETSLFIPLLAADEPPGIPAAWRLGTTPGFVQRRECFRRAWRYLEQHQEIPDLALVHGTVYSPQTASRIDHAWVSLPGDVVFDGVVQRFYTAGTYQALARNEADATYRWSGALQLSTQRVVDCADPGCRARGEPHCHTFGPWNGNGAVES